MTLVWIWLAGVVLGPVAVVFASWGRVHVEGLRRLALAAAAMMLALCSACLWVPGLDAFSLAVPGATGGLLGTGLLRVDPLAAVLIPLPSALWLLTLAVTPRARLDAPGLRRNALAALVTTLAFLTDSPALLWLWWTASTLLFVAALSAPEHRGARRVVALYLVASTVLLGVGLGLVFGPSDPRGPAPAVGLWLVMIAALIRKGIFPFHAWVPEAFDRGRLGPATLFSAPQLGAYVTLVVVVPRAPPGMLRVVGVLALITAAYAVALALVQRDARRSCGYLFVSQSALVMAGLDYTSEEALAGALVLWLSSALAFAGIARCVLGLEARRGRLDLSQHHGGYEKMPHLAVSFLVLGLACAGFPGTLGFVGGELLLQGAVRRFPGLGFLVLVTGALTGVAVLRMYFSLFCGRPGAGVELRLRRRETVAFATTAAVLIALGLLPGALVDSRLRVSRELMRRQSMERRTRGPGRPARRGTHPSAPRAGARGGFVSLSGDVAHARRAHEAGKLRVETLPKLGDAWAANAAPSRPPRRWAAGAPAAPRRSGVRWPRRPPGGPPPAAACERAGRAPAPRWCPRR